MLVEDSNEISSLIRFLTVEMCFFYIISQRSLGGIQDSCLLKYPTIWLSGSGSDRKMDTFFIRDKILTGKKI